MRAKLAAALVALSLFAMTTAQEGADQPGAEGELRTDGWAWTQSHAQIQEPAQIVGGPLEVNVNNVPGGDVAFWVFPGPRELDPHVFGTPEMPLGYAPPFPLYGVPLEYRAVSEDGNSFTTTTQPTSFSDNWTSVQGATVGMRVVDVTATDAAVTEDRAEFQMQFQSPDEAHTYTVTVNEVLPHGFAYPFFGGVATNMLLHGFSGVGTPMMPTEFTYAAFWGVGTVQRDGEVVNENQLVHVMVTEPVRTADYELVFDPNVPPPDADPTDKVLHLMVPPFRVEMGAQPPLQPQPVQTGVMVEGPEGQMEQPFFHVMIEEIEVSAQRLEQQEAPAEAAEEEQPAAEEPGAVDEQLVAQGEDVYAARCSVCHGNQGQGTIGPALAGNETLQNVQATVRQILSGGGGMPGFADQLTTEQIAAVTSYIRTAWDNDFGRVQPEQVEEISGQGN